MKKILNLTIIALLGISTATYAQDKPKQKYVIAKGTKMFTGRINAGFSSAQGYRSINFGIGEQNGFFVANNLSIGSVVNYDLRYTQDYINFGPGNATGDKRVQMIHSPSIGFALRYYKMFTPRFGFFGEFIPSVGVSINTARVYGNFPTSSISHNINLDVSITPNLVFFVTDKFALEAGFGRLGYAHTFGGGGSHSANLGVTPRLNLGMSFYLGKGVLPKS